MWKERRGSSFESAQISARTIAETALADCAIGRRYALPAVSTPPTLVPTLAAYLLRAKHTASRSRNPLALFQQSFERIFEQIRTSYRGVLSTFVRRRAVFIPVFLGVCFAIFLLTPWLGQDFFPN